jgi:hypothetical protein
VDRHHRRRAERAGEVHPDARQRVALHVDHFGLEVARLVDEDVEVEQVAPADAAHRRTDQLDVLLRERALERASRAEHRDLVAEELELAREAHRVEARASQRERRGQEQDAAHGTLRRNRRGALLLARRGTTRIPDPRGRLR